MPKIDQSGFNNQPSDWIGAAEAAELLGVKRATLYAYVSRGLVTARGQRRGRRYRRDDLERLATRRDARRGHGAVAAAALRWGEPVLDTAVSEITDAVLRYRGRDATELARESSFERVADILWDEKSTVPWTVLPIHRRPRPVALEPGDSPLLAMRALLPLLAIADRDRLVTTREIELERARSIIGRLVDCLNAGTGDTIAERLAGDRRTRRSAAVRAIDAALILAADHGLNVSTFAARVAASAGADLYASISAALAAFSGPLHGGSCEALEALLPRCKSDADARELVREHGRLGRELPGFGHVLYRHGDVRAPALLELATKLGPRRRLTQVERLRRAARRARREPPTIDLAIVALAAALGWPPGSATALFAVGRSAGWVAHILEQRRAGYLLRPRARFIAPG